MKTKQLSGYNGRDTQRQGEENRRTPGILAAIGEALIDFIPDRTGCGFSEVESFSPKCGGAPANVCGAYAALGGRARLITQLGDDPFGRKISEELINCGIDTSCVSFTDKANTALAFVSLGEDGSRTFSFYRKPSADMLLSEEQIKKQWFDGVYVLHFCSVSLGDFPMKKAHEKAIKYAREKGALISFDPNLRFMLWEDMNALCSTVKDFIPMSDILKISDEEIEFITGEKDIHKAAHKLFTGNVKLIVYTCGKNGAYALTEKAEAFSESIKTEAVDTTGAGDGFIGSFLYALNCLGICRGTLPDMDSGTLQRCLDFANRFCGESVRHHGAIPSYRKIDF